MKIAICSHGDEGMKEWKDISFENKEWYCWKHKYTFFGSSHQYDDRHPSWARLPMMIELLKYFDWLFWSDPDSLIVNTDKRLEEFITPQHDFIISKTHVINHGEYFVKNSPLGLKILIDTYNQTQFIDHMWRENQACIHLFTQVYDSEIMSKVRIDENASYNVFAKNYRHGDFIAHYPGEHKDLNAFKAMAETIKY